MSGILAAVGLLSGSIIDPEALLDTAIASLLAGVGVTFAASAAIFGFSTLAEMRLQGRPLAALGAGLIGVVASAAFAAAIVLGLIVMVSG